MLKDNWFKLLLWLCGFGLLAAITRNGAEFAIGIAIMCALAAQAERHSA